MYLNENDVGAIQKSVFLKRKKNGTGVINKNLFFG